MDYSKLRLVPRDSIIYSLLRSACADYTKENNLGRYDSYFASVLGHTSPTGNIQFVSSIQDVSLRKFSLDEFVVLIRELGVGSQDVINRLLDGTGLICIPVEAPLLPSVEAFGVLHLVKSGHLAEVLTNALSDGEIDKKESVALHKSIGELISLLSSVKSMLTPVEVVSDEK